MNLLALFSLSSIFYLIANISGKNYEFPTIYRIDRILDYSITDDVFRIPYSDRFEEGEFKKRIQFMTAGKLIRIQFMYKDNSLDAIIERLPTARVLGSDNEGTIIEAEVLGRGV